MASSATLLLFFLLLTIISPTFSSSVIEDLTNLTPPHDFNVTIANNCVHNPSLRYCTTPTPDLHEIFKFTIVASHLCLESHNPDCVNSFETVNLCNRHSLAPLYLSFSFFWKYCPLTIKSIDLSNCSLKGTFPIDILHCTQIQSLDLSRNNLVGDFPLQSFTQLENLTSVNLSYNNFRESEISDTQFFKRFNSSSFVRSGLIPSYHKFQFNAFVVLLCFPLFIVLVVWALGFLCLRRPDYLPTFLRRKHNFTLPMLKAATDNFSEETRVAKVGKLEIYRGRLRDGVEVKIEICRDKICKKFVEECRVLVQLEHKNVVKVLGWCGNRVVKAIVTEWRDGESVEMWLDRAAPSWRQRLKVLRRVLEGIEYLQEEWSEVGFDVGGDCVWLGGDGEPLISRFRVGDGNSNKKNIAKFGVFLLEMITNKHPGEFKNGEKGFIEWVRQHYPENIWKVTDGRLQKTGITQEQAKRGIGLGLMCADIPTEHHFKLAVVYDMITRFSESSLVGRSK